MDMEVEDPGGPPSPCSTKETKKSSSCRPWIEEERMTEKNRGNRREKVFAGRYVYETVVVQGARVPALLALMSSTIGGNRSMELVNRDFKATINIRRYALLKTRPADLTRSNFAGQPRRA